MKTAEPGCLGSAEFFLGGALVCCGGGLETKRRIGLDPRTVHQTPRGAGLAS